MNDQAQKTLKPFKIWVTLVCCLLLAGAVFAAWRLIRTAPSPRRQSPGERAALVETLRIFPTRAETVVEAFGTAVPAREVNLPARVSGQVAEVSRNFAPGGRFRSGEIMLRLDPADYRLALKREKAALARVEQEYRMELGRQDIARHEWTFLKEAEETADSDRELALRQPQLKQAEAALAAARAALEQAELNLARTEVAAPFNCVVLEENLDVGSQVAAQSAIARLAGTDEFWVLLTLPVSELAWIVSGEGEPAARVALFPTGASPGQAGWEGRVVRVKSHLEAGGRLAQVVVEVPGPLEAKPPLLLGTYLRAEIQGRAVEEVLALPVTALREGNRVWVMDADNRLRIRPAEVLRKTSDRALLGSGLQAGDILVTSELAAPVEGMLLREAGSGGGAGE